MYGHFVGIKAVHYERALKKIIQQRRREQKKTLNQRTHRPQPTKTEKCHSLDTRYFVFILFYIFTKYGNKNRKHSNSVSVEARESSGVRKVNVPHC